MAEYERAVIFCLGKLLPQPKGPGVALVFAPIDRMVRVSRRGNSAGELPRRRLRVRHAGGTEQCYRIKTGNPRYQSLGRCRCLQNLHGTFDIGLPHQQADAAAHP